VRCPLLGSANGGATTTLRETLGGAATSGLGAVSRRPSVGGRATAAIIAPTKPIPAKMRGHVALMLLPSIAETLGTDRIGGTGQRFNGLLR
jgi:hypothetical protein